ncbi:MAG: hypothetical protein DMF77_20505 [Acidobacteria bacterium]|nr:MAG: hypothetical protein DMF77_20505 [Acidobacteriota bacterium]
MVVGRAWEMLSYAAPGPPTLSGDAVATDVLARTEDDDASDVRAHDLARGPRDESWLGPGRAAAPLRPALGALQSVMVPALTPLALLGAALILAARWRSGLLLLALPLYYLSTESFFLYEWRVAVPMHYALFACAAAPVVAAWSALRSAAGSALDPPDQNQAG